MSISKFALIATAGLLAAFAGSASAQTSTWNFGDRQPNGACTGTFAAHGSATNTLNGNVISCTQQPSGTVVDLSLRAFSTGGPNFSYVEAAVNDQGGNGVAVYNPTEARTGTNPDHGLDNGSGGGGTDAMLLSFTSSQVLRNVTVGWTGDDGDFQVLRWVGSSTATQAHVRSSLVGVRDLDITGPTGGWELVNLINGQGGIDNPDATFAVNSGGSSSSYWLISAYNPHLGGSGFTTGIDSIKLLGVTTGVTARVSAPGTLALAGLAVFGLLVARRKTRA